jgi:hypothetical protein
VRSCPGVTRAGTEQVGPGGPHAALQASEIRCLQQADLVITSTDRMRSAVIAHGVPARRVRVIPDGPAAQRSVSGETRMPAERTSAAQGDLYRDAYRELMDRWPPVPQPAGPARKPT